jgi:hypothetical protein
MGYTVLWYLAPSYYAFSDIPEYAQEATTPAYRICDVHLDNFIVNSAKRTGGIVRNANCSTLELRAWASQVQGSQPKSDDSACSWQGLDKVGTRLGHGLDVKFTTR